MISRRLAVLLSSVAMSLGWCGSAVGQEYIEGVNDNLPVEPGWTATGGHEQAFRWTAQNTFDLTMIQFHSSPISSGTIRLRRDTGQQPGEVLRQVFYSSNSTGWGGAEFSEPYPIEAGQTYFVSMHCVHDYSDFLAAGGVHLTYYWTVNGVENWNGPFNWAGHRMIKFFGFAGGVECDRVRSFKAKCKSGRLTASIKSQLEEGTRVLVDNDGDRREAIINRRGKGKVKWTQQTGEHHVFIVECPEYTRHVDCE